MILTINCGSSSLKYQLFDADLAGVVAKGLVSRIGEPVGRIAHEGRGRRAAHETAIPDHGAAFALVLEALLDPTSGGLDDVADIVGVGHRVVHGGEAFGESVVIGDSVVAEIAACIPLAPLHNPANLTGIAEARRRFPQARHVAVFDTAFHRTLPAEAHVFPLPYRLFAEHHLRRYGFHGTSCRWVGARAAEMMGRPAAELKLVVCHLGNGVTIDAIAGGRSVDTSMGFGTFCGAMMGTRPGDFDPALIFHLHKALGMDLEAIERMIYKESGLLGVSGRSNDMREILAGVEAGDARCRLAFAMFAHMTRKYVGAYAAAMGGIDGLIFTAGIGENCAQVRAEICKGLDFLGVELDAAVNASVQGTAAAIGRAGGRTAVLVMPTDEERMIAIDTRRLLAAEDTEARG